MSEHRLSPFEHRPSLMDEEEALGARILGVPDSRAPWP